jgi:hypothetical protein
MKEFLTRLWLDLIGRIDGPLPFQLILQPVAAAFLAIRAGLKDVRMGYAAYGWAILSDPVRRHYLLCQGSKEIAKVFVVAVIIDLIYEIIVFHAIYVGQSMIVAVAVALVPYVLIRGPINRIVRRGHRGRTPLNLADLSGRSHS